MSMARIGKAEGDNKPFMKRWSSMRKLVATKLLTSTTAFLPNKMPLAL